MASLGFCITRTLSHQFNGCFDSSLFVTTNVVDTNSLLLFIQVLSKYIALQFEI